jgi:hypothetical protein
MRDTGTDRGGEAAWRRTFRHDPTQNVSRFSSHRMASFRSPNAQALFDVVLKVANPGAGHGDDLRSGWRGE